MAHSVSIRLSPRLLLCWFLALLCIPHLNNIEDLCYKLQEAIDIFNGCIFEYTQAKNNDAVKKAIRYIVSNFSMPLTLEAVAEHVHLNPAYFSTLPIKAMVQRIRAAGIPASVSNTAGTFVCNHLMYGVLYTLARHYPHIRGGFMHVPFVPSQVVNRPCPAPCLSIPDIASGIQAALLAIAENEKDILAAEGKTH